MLLSASSQCPCPIDLVDYLFGQSFTYPDLCPFKVFHLYDSLAVHNQFCGFYCAEDLQEY